MQFARVIRPKDLSRLVEGRRKELTAVSKVDRTYYSDDTVSPKS